MRVEVLGDDADQVIQEIGIEDGEQTIDFSIEYYIQTDTDETADTLLVAGIVILGLLVIYGGVRLARSKSSSTRF